MIAYQNSRLDYLRAQSLAQKVQMMPIQNPYNQVWNPQMNNQPIQNALRPRFMSNMGTQRNMGGYSYGGIR